MNIFYDEKKSRRIATARDKSLFNFNLYGNGLGALVIVGCALCCYLYFDFEYSVLFEKEVKRADADGEISQKQAKTIALKDAGLLESEVTFTRCEKDMDDGMINFEIKFFGLDGREYEYKISAIDGSIIGKDYEFDHDHEFYDYDDHEFYDYDDDDFDGAFDFD